LYWVIQFKETGSDRLIEDMGAIPYGKVPRGYTDFSGRRSVATYALGGSTI